MSADELLRLAELLPPTERRLLAQRIIGTLAPEVPSASRRRLRWSDMRGRVPYPFFGEDAQAYISRTRKEADERRRIS